jgi:hypothetical protein
MANHNPTPCHLCDSPAVAVFYFSHGCVCSPATVQPLCLHHTQKSRPPVKSGGSIELIKDLTIDGSFEKFWQKGGTP